MSTQPQPVRVVLELQGDAEPVRGTVTDLAGDVSPYVGWLALITVLEQLRRQPAGTDPRGVSG